MALGSMKSLWYVLLLFSPVSQRWSQQQHKFCYNNFASFAALVLILKNVAISLTFALRSHLKGAAVCASYLASRSCWFTAKHSGDAQCVAFETFQSMTQADISMHKTKTLDIVYNWTDPFRNDDYSRVMVCKMSPRASCSPSNFAMWPAI